MGNCISGPSQPSGHYELEETRHSRRATTAVPQTEPSSSKPHRSSHRSSENRGRAIASGSRTVTAQVQIKPGVVNRLEGDIKLVGIKKLLGYFDNIPSLKYTGYTQESLTQEQEARGMKVMILPSARQSDNSLCIFVYDPILLQNYLNLPKNQNILNSHGWPTDAKLFVERVSAENTEDPDLFELIAIAFNNPKPEYHNKLDLNSLR